MYLYRYHHISVFADEPPPAPGFAHLRLRPPVLGLVMSPDRIVSEIGFVCYPLVQPETQWVSGLPRVAR
jgi:hypothetical protein